MWHCVTGWVVPEIWRTVEPLHSDQHKGTTVLSSIGNCLPSDTTSHPRQLESLNRGITNPLSSSQQWKQTCYRTTCLPVLCHHNTAIIIYVSVQSNSIYISRCLVFSNLLLLFLILYSICIFGCKGTTSVHAIHVIYIPPPVIVLNWSVCNLAYFLGLTYNILLPAQPCLHHD